MPDYVLMGDLSGRIPPKFLIEALDDDEDGQADPLAWQSVVADVQAKIDGLLGTRFTVPFANPIPAIVSGSARVFACELLYLRRGFSGEKNPFASESAQALKALEKIAAGDLPLVPTIPRAQASASAVTERARTTSRTGRLTA